jgi:hexosaminidase
VGVTAVTVVVLTEGEFPTRETDYAYNISYSTSGSSANTVQVSCASPFGVAYALETLLQLAEDSTCGGGASFTVVDAPDFPHRGLMIDTGRRFYSVDLVESVLEGMAMMKMNVMHLFLSELCFRVESKIFPGVHSQMNCTGPQPRYVWRRVCGGKGGGKGTAAGGL